MCTTVQEFNYAHTFVNSAVFMPSKVRGLKFMPSLKGTDLVNDCVVLFRKGLSKCIADPVVWILIIPKSLRD